MHVRRVIQAGAPGLVWTSFSIPADEATTREHEGLRPGEIAVRLNGRLTVAWKEVDGANAGDRKVVYAAVKAGGTSIRLDWKGCPAIEAELASDDPGSAFASAINAEVVGQLEFRAPDELPGTPPPGLPGIEKSSTGLRPVVLVETLHIRAEPYVSTRERNPVKSTTIGIRKDR